MSFLLAVENLSNQAMSVPVQSGDALTTTALTLLIVAVGLALAFEFVNGFHDTANAVATVIYTHSMKPWIAVIWSGCWNLIGVLTSGGGVAFAVLALLPVEMVLHVGTDAGFAMVFALLISAMIWNLGTWYMGLPASSTHSLFGAIIGVGLANAMMSSGHNFGDGVNWHKLKDTLLALMISPIIGFVFSGLLLLASKRLVKWPQLYTAPEKGKAPPWSIRGLLILTCTGVSFGHGRNDGQKGMGLVLLILIGILPARYALNFELTPAQLQSIQTSGSQVQSAITKMVPAGTPTPAHTDEILSDYIKSSGVYSDKTLPALLAVNQRIADGLKGKQKIADLTAAERSALRTSIYLTSGVLSKLEAQNIITDKNLRATIDPEKTGYKALLDSSTQYIPPWVKVATALALGLGTMIGWKRIVVTVGEKIGKTHLSYAQGASAETVAGVTILLADQFNLPVSTTHVLSSGVAGTMAANKSGLQMDTLRNLLLAWVLTLPACTFLGAALFAGGLVVVLHDMLPVLIVGLLLASMAFLLWRFRFAPPRKSPFDTAPAAG